MYCKHCGKHNSEASIYCQYCGKEINTAIDTVGLQNEEKNSLDKYLDQNIFPYPYNISPWKLIIMCLATFGIYEIYWFYRQWKSFNSELKLKHGGFTLFILALFSPLTSFTLFKHISESIKQTNNGKGLESGALAILYFVLNRFLIGFLPLLAVQNKINKYWDNKYHSRIVRSNFGIWNWIIVLIVGVIMFFSLYTDDSSSTTNSTSIPETAVIEKDSREEIASSVVNIYCPSTSNAKDESSSGGSGIMLTDDGIVLTNSHIIPQNKKNILVDETGCLVILPDSVTGQPSEIYLAHPIVIPGISEDYDLAYMQIYDAYYDEEEGEYKGVYPRTFPAFDDTNRCNNEDIKLGDAVRIYGYPAISGGYSLTITDGVVSSFPGEGLIVTSAKISHGNSGGLAVDKDGCMLGVPSLVSSDENESLGVIYSMSLVRQFDSEVIEFLKSKK